MAAVRHLEPIPDRYGHEPRPRHLRLVEPGARRTTSPRRQAGVYRRRRLLAGAVVSLVIVAGFRAVSPSEAGGGAAPAPSRAPEVYVVQPGDSYWSIASSLDRPGDIRETVDELSAANGGQPLEVGDRVSLPG